MLAILEKMMLVIEPLSLLVLLLYSYAFFGRSGRPEHHVNMVMGGVFGIAAVMAISFPLTVAEGIVFDMRNLFVGVAAGFFGLVGAGIAFSFAAVARIAMGGEGVTAGLAALSVATMAGLIWARCGRSLAARETVSFVVLGLMISAHLMVALFLPAAARAAFLSDIAATLLVGNVCGAVLLGKLITRERRFLQQESRLSYEADTDALTQLVNAEAAADLYERLSDTCLPGRGFAVLCIDVDDMQDLNDNYGRAVGDLVLVEIAGRISTCLRPGDVFARTRGDRFLILLYDLTEGDTQAIANRCRQSISQMPVLTTDLLVKVSVSIGCAWAEGKAPFNTLRRTAESALSEAKAKGRDRVVLYGGDDTLSDGDAPRVAAG